MDFIKTTTWQHKLSQRKEIVMNCSYLSLMTMMTLMEWTSLIPLQVMKHSKLRCIYMTNCSVWKVMHQFNSICTLPPSPRPLWAFVRLVSPRGGALANFAPPEGRAFAIRGATPELLICPWFPIQKYKEIEDFTGNTSRLAHLDGKNL